MGQKSAAYDENGIVTGFYDDIDSPVPPGALSIELTHEEWATWIKVPSCRVVDGKLAEIPFVPVFLTAAALVELVDAKIAQIYEKWMRFQAEYEFREKAALAYKTAGYTGECGVWISSFAIPAGMTSKQACDMILTQSENLRSAQQTLGALRMRKYELLPLSGEAAQEKFDEINTAINDAVQLIK